ncbi:MAG: redox-sensing transcriptional repressor Rex [Angelakisella sp.]
MKRDKPVSNSVINRLPRYYRFLGKLLSENITRVSSKELSTLMKVTASQIRQDLNCFGGFGQQGYGYNVELLHKEIGEILGVDNKTPAILIGAGNLGKVIATQVNLETRGFRLIGAFDRSPAIVGQPLVGLTVRDISELSDFCTHYHPKAAIICIPTSAAAELADTLVDLGIVGFWNFSSYDFSYSHENIKVVNVHLSDSIMTLSYKVTHLNVVGEE